MGRDAAPMFKCLLYLTHNFGQASSAALLVGARGRTRTDNHGILIATVLRCETLPLELLLHKYFGVLGVAWYFNQMGNFPHTLTTSTIEVII